MAILNLRRLKQKVVGGTTQPLKIGGILEDDSDAKITIDTDGTVEIKTISETSRIIAYKMFSGF